MKMFTLTSLFLLSTSIAMAAPMTSDIPLDPASIGPGQTGSISLNKLVKDITYDVTCIVASNGQAQQDYDAVKVNFNSFSLNGVHGSSVMRVEAKGDAVASGMDLVIPSVYSGLNALQFTNIDDTDYINVYNCVAKVHFNNN